ncbi:hypothetical protein Taro_022537 [Colocasia esculenta]|uniref:Thioredoxin domain-containing protein n=1 Tax=Colocasia esculenta TaxID=4460 RepID=A0A843V8N3_COLES|nr:hypothetical protein [Colocasia esculenta]
MELMCGPCQYMVPVLDRVSIILQNKIQIVKIDAQKEKAVANKYRIEALPTFIIFRDGKPCDRFVNEKQPGPQEDGDIGEPKTNLQPVNEREQPPSPPAGERTTASILHLQPVNEREQPPSVQR